MQDYRVVIQNRRKRLGLSQSKVAKLVGITPTFMSEIESGRKSPSVEVFFRICETLELRVFPDEE